MTGDLQYTEYDPRKPSEQTVVEYCITHMGEPFTQYFFEETDDSGSPDTFELVRIEREGANRRINAAKQVIRRSGADVVLDADGTVLARLEIPDENRGAY